MNDILKNTLLDNRCISEIEVKNDESFKSIKYAWLVSCKLDVCGKWMPIVIGIPKHWQLNLFDFYLTQKELPFIPHLGKDGKLCLFNLEEKMIISDHFDVLLNKCIKRAIDVISAGILGKNKEDFIKEFDSYFALLESAKYAKVVLPVEKKSQIISFCESKANIFASINPNDFQIWNYTSTQKNGIYFYIKPPQQIYPPNIFKDDVSKFLNLLLNFVAKKDFQKLKEKCKNKLMLIFEIKQNEYINNCGFLIENPQFNEEWLLQTFDKITPLAIKRVDKNFLFARTSLSKNKLFDKSILLIGCGSIGGYVFHNLIKFGCEHITLVDDDIVEPKNICRHFLGLEFVGKNKATALKEYASRMSNKIKAIDTTIEYAIEHKKIDLNDFDFIISAVGSHTLNLWLNDYLKNNKITKSVFYAWNEPLNIGYHALRINIKSKGDYRNLFDENMIDLSAYTKSGQEVAVSYLGCSDTFVPYGFTLSIESSIMLLSLIQREADGKIQDNILVSKKGEDCYFKEKGFLVSNRYKNQENQCKEVKICDLKGKLK